MSTEEAEERVLAALFVSRTCTISPYDAHEAARLLKQMLDAGTDREE